MKFTTLEAIPAVKDYLDRIGAESRSTRVAVIREEGSLGYWTDLYTIRFSKEGEVSVLPETNPLVCPTTEEAQLIKTAFSSIVWPEHVFIDDENDPKLPKVWREAEEKNRFVFRNTEGKIIMLQVRVDEPNKKKYIPITYWSDGEYRFCEPGEKIPLYGQENLKKSPFILLVEGAKTAKYLQWMIDGETPEAREALSSHPWGDKLKAFCVCAWVSGALSPLRSDWSPINKSGAQKVYVALDNDAPGRQALPMIAKQIRLVTHAIEFTNEWPACADLYDPFPEVFFKEIQGKKYYVGPSMTDCSYPATWMTDLVTVTEGKKERKVPVLRSHAKGLYQWIEDQGSFCYLEQPELNYSAETLDACLRPFSDSKKTSELILQNFNGRVVSFDYNPSTTKRKILVNGSPVINLYTPSEIKPQAGDPGPWLEFMEQLIPDEEERGHLLRWIATLYAKPEIRMIFAPLLISTQTGTGKSTLGQIAATLVGRQNASFPNEQAVSSEFNGWASKKRLVVVNEIYSGHSWKMFTRLKEMITDDVITLRMMRENPINISNYAHFFMCSNSLAALKIDAQDRRIFAPSVTEERWPDHKWNDFHEWLESGGYSIVAQWCLDYGKYVKRGERAPQTSRKTEMIESSASKAHNKIEELAVAISKEKEPISFSINNVVEWLESVTRGRVYETQLEIRKLFSEFGLRDAKEFGIKKRVSYKSSLTYFVMNESAAKKLNGLDEAQMIDMMKSFTKTPNEIINSEEML